MTSDEDLEFRVLSYAADEAYEIDGDEPFVGFPQYESQDDSRLHALLESCYVTYMTINLVDYLHPRSPLLPPRRRA